MRVDVCVWGARECVRSCVRACVRVYDIALAHRVLQRLLRGRAAQNDMHGARERRLELIRELRVVEERGPQEVVSRTCSAQSLARALARAHTSESCGLRRIS